jgi:peptidyl-prolyl cis-trans isomerase B (cyclophilin B)
MLALLAAIVLALAGCGDDDEGDLQAPAGSTQAQPEPTPTEQQAQTTPGGCKAVEAPSPRETSKQPKPKQALDASKSWSLVVKTNCGDFTIGLDLESGPNAAASMVALARSGWFDRTIFHRIAPGFVIQGGDPTASGSGGPGYTTVDPPPKDARYTKGVVAMAKTPDEPAGAGGSQFFVVTGQDAGLPPDYAVVGKITDGQDVVQKIGRLGDQSEQPTEAVVISTVEVVED